VNILVCVKQVPETAGTPRKDRDSLARTFVSQVINPADESALELALQLRDRFGGSVSVMTMGRKSAEGMLREIAARGGDSLYLLNDPAFAGSDTLATSLTLRAAIQRVGMFDLILCGRRTTDGETGQVGPELAALLGVPVITNVVEFVYEDSRATMVRLLEHGSETVTCALPAVVTLCEWSYPLRLPSLLGQRRARTIPVHTFGLNELGLEQDSCGLRGSPTRVVKLYDLTSKSRQCETSPDVAAGINTILQEIKARR
jgi:electron transfer flavoprotein beta subunit